jgi:SPP1 gp7 family putative phage head morphogenesis protein
VKTLGYWEDRMAQSQTKITNKTTKQIEKQLEKYYATTTKRVIADFEATYDKLLATVADGREPTPADLYKLEKYWTMQADLRKELAKLGNKEIAMLSKMFETNYFEVYYGLNIEGQTAFNTLDLEAAKQVINSIWVADGKAWSERIWDNTAALQEALNETLIETVLAGRKTTDLKNLLIEKFNVSYSSADALVRTELAHIQTEAAKQRYTDYGIEMVEIWADEDERRCEQCGKLHMTKYPVGASVPIPAHPRCRCCIVPVVEQ